MGCSIHPIAVGALCIGGTTLHGRYFYLMLNPARYGQQEEKHENSIDNRWQ